MIYLDYSATTPVCDGAMTAIREACAIPGNPNSVHTLGLSAKNMIESDRENILSLLGVPDKELIPTSGATEANNLALRGAFLRFSPKGKNHIITTQLEHSSITAPFSSLQGEGAETDFVNLLPDGTVDIKHLESLIKDNTLLVSIGAVNSETGIRQPIEKIGEMLKAKYPSVLFHTDATQAVGKIKIDYTNVDMLSFSAHKFYCFKGIGGLIKNKKLVVIPQMKGGGSTTRFRSGTPCSELIHAMSKSLTDTLSDFDEKTKKLNELNGYLRREIAKYPGVIINSPDDAIPQILNFSLMGSRAEDLQEFLSEREIYISTRTACAANVDMSATVLMLTEDEARATSSVRISLSYKTEKAEIDEFLKAFDEFYKNRKGI